MTQEKKYREVLFVGRFQPPHLGHVDCLSHALEMSERVVLVIGSINVIDKMTNPFSYSQRCDMWQLILQENRWEDRVRIIGSNDYADNDIRWSAEILAKVPQAEAIFGHNEWTNNALAREGLVVVSPGLIDRTHLEGRGIRAAMEKGNETWEQWVPKPVYQFLTA